MGMSINEAIEHGKEQLDIFGGEHKEFIETSIETMRKYKKIEQIMNQEQAEWWGVVKDTWLYKEIREVLDNGNDD